MRIVQPTGRLPPAGQSEPSGGMRGIKSTGALSLFRQEKVFTKDLS